MAESAEARERAHGKLGERERAVANKTPAEREDVPEHVFLEPERRKYPVKTKHDGEWKYDRELLLAAARRARMEHDESLAERADAIRRREFDGAEDALAFDKDSVRDFDRDGRLHISSTPISKASVDEYFGREIPNSEALGLEPDRKYRLLRDPEELKKGIETANNRPVMIKHIRQSAADPQKDKIVGSTGTDAEFAAPHVKNSMVIWDKEGIDGVNDNSRREISGSYHYVPDMTPGTWEGQPYDGVIRNIEFNHFALVPEGRVGHDVLVEDELPPALRNRTMKLSRRAIVAKGALAGWLTPLLAQDQKLPDLTPVVRGVTAKNWAQAKPEIESRLTAALTGRLANDASLREVHGFLDSLDNEGKDQMEPDEMEVVDRRPAKDAPNEAGLTDPEMRERGREKLGGTDANPMVDKVFQYLDGKIDSKLMEGLRELMSKPGEDRRAHDETEEEMQARHKKEAEDIKRAKDSKARDMAACDETEEEMRARHKREGDALRARDRRPARDETPEEKAKREKEEKERREAERAEDRRANDAAITAAITNERTRQEAIRQAERDVRPWIGDLVLAQDSADAVYRLALETVGVDIKGVHPSAYRAVLLAQPKPDGRTPPAKLAMDAASAKTLADRFPHLAAVRRY